MRAIALGVIFLVAGCGPGPSPDVPTPVEATTAGHSLPSEPTRDVPSRDDVRIVVAEDLSQYLATTDAITAAGGQEAERILSLVTPDWATTEMLGFAEYGEGGLRTAGRTTAHNVVVQSVRWVDEDSLEVALFACIDSSKVIVFPDALEPPEALEVWLAGAAAETPLNDSDEFEIGEFLDSPEVRVGRQDPVLAWFVGPEPGALVVDRLETWRGHHSCTQE